MAEHYFTNSETLRHQQLTIAIPFEGREFIFDTDAGVFSREHLDSGSALLIASVGPLSGRVCDMGCGWGPIGILLASKNPQAHFLLLDINERAVALAQQNIEKNHITNACAMVSDGLYALPQEEKLSAVVSNPPIRIGKQAMYDLFAQAHRALADDGEMYLVIRKQQGAPSAKEYLQSLFGSCQTIARSSGYWVLYCKKEARA